MASATVKLFASLAEYLPPGAKDHATKIALSSNDATIMSTLEALRVPQEKCHLVLLNGIFVSPSERPGCTISDGDTIAVWPPVAGG